MKHISLLLAFVLCLFSCSKDDDPTTPGPDTGLYFPPVSGTNWETVSPGDLGWDESAVQPLTEFLSEKNTKAFVILVDGRIALEAYFDGHTVTDTWEWNSAGKTLVGTTTGLAQEDGFLST